MMRTSAPPAGGEHHRNPGQGWKSAAGGGWWLVLAGLWAVATAADRLWLAADRRLPAWDQADYLNAAVDHGRALALLAGGGWRGWEALLDLSPKIPPLASLVNGSVMALAGQDVQGASWSLALWHGLLLVAVACWARQLRGPGFGLLAAALTVTAPALAALRVDYTLDLPLTATTTLTLWRLGRWQARAPLGGGWGRALAAALALATALLVKQSALLLVALPALWAAGQGLGRRGARLQVLAALALVAALILPWLHHNWITTLGGSERAVFESARAEGDPSGLSLAGLLYYPLRLPAQLGLPACLLGLAGGIGAGLGALGNPGAGEGEGRRSRWAAAAAHPVRTLPPGWPWLLGCALAALVLTTLNPNKDGRYLAPLLPLLLIPLAAGWMALFARARSRWGRRRAVGLLVVALAGAGTHTTLERAQEVRRHSGSPLAAVAERVRQAVGLAPTTVLVIPSAADVNQHTFTYLGRLQGGQVVGREIGKQASEHARVLEQAEWLVLATGDQGTRHKAARRLSRKVRRDGRFLLAHSWAWSEGRRLELWRRRSGAPAHRFDQRFIRLARGMERGPTGLAEVFAAIGPEHQLDGHFLYQQRVRRWAEDALRHDPTRRDALWSRALLATLGNRPGEAAAWYGRLQKLEPANPWPVAYRAVVLLAGWNPWGARSVIEAAPEPVRREPVVRALGDLGATLTGDLRALPSLGGSLRQAVERLERDLAPPRPEP